MLEFGTTRLLISCPDGDGATVEGVEISGEWPGCERCLGMREFEKDRCRTLLWNVGLYDDTVCRQCFGVCTDLEDIVSSGRSALSDMVCKRVRICTVHCTSARNLAQDAVETVLQRASRPAGSCCSLIVLISPA